MSEHRKRHRHERSNKSEPYKAESQQEVNESSLVIQMFRGFQQELDCRNDKYERIVKLSRDITIESKRAIFLLHRVTNVTESAEVIQQTEEKLAALENTKFRDIARELVGEDPFQFLRAYSPGLQEYIEALTFLFYLKQNCLVPLADVQARLTFPNIDQTSKNSEADKTDIDVNVDGVDQKAKHGSDDKNEKDDDKVEDVCTESSKSCENSKDAIKVLVPASEYILGVADLTGEMMRKAINAVGAGDLDRPFEVCRFLQEIETAYSALGNANREVHRKLHTLRQSLRKVESACYTLKVRGSEIPKHMLVDMISQPSMSQFNIDDTEVIDED